MDVNAKGPCLCAQQVARDRPGAIINPGSVGGTDGFPKCISHGPSKDAVHQKTRQMTVGLAERHLRGNCVPSGILATDMIRGHIDAGRAREADNNNRMRQRHAGEGMDIRQVMVSLAGEQARETITGLTLPADRGFPAYGLP